MNRSGLHPVPKGHQKLTLLWGLHCCLKGWCPSSLKHTGSRKRHAIQVAPIMEEVTIHRWMQCIMPSCIIGIANLTRDHPDAHKPKWGSRTVDRSMAEKSSWEGQLIRWLRVNERMNEYTNLINIKSTRTDSTTRIRHYAAVEGARLARVSSRDSTVVMMWQ